MASWVQSELQKIAEADDLHIAPLREDRATYGTPTWIWSVRVDGDLYVRAFNGQSSRWYKAALRQKAGRIIAAGLTKEVTFEPIDGSINDRVDEAYRSKYRDSAYLVDDFPACAQCDDENQAARHSVERLKLRSKPCKNAR